MVLQDGPSRRDRVHRGRAQYRHDLGRFRRAATRGPVAGRGSGADQVAAGHSRGAGRPGAAGALPSADRVLRTAARSAEGGESQGSRSAPPPRHPAARAPAVDVRLGKVGGRSAEGESGHREAPGGSRDGPGGAESEGRRCAAPPGPGSRPGHAQGRTAAIPRWHRRRDRRSLRQADAGSGKHERSASAGRGARPRRDRQGSHRRDQCRSGGAPAGHRRRPGGARRRGGTQVDARARRRSRGCRVRP